MRKTRYLELGMAICALAALLCGAKAVRGQEVTAAITGTVTDPSGAPLAGATVTAKDQDRGTTWPATTNSEGIYALLRISVGTYRLRVEAKGFQTAVYPPFTLVLNQTARIDVQMDDSRGSVGDGRGHRSGTFAADGEHRGEQPGRRENDYHAAARGSQLHSVVPSLAWDHDDP